MMPVKMTGAQYKAFLAADWGPDAMWEETEIAKNGEVVDGDHDGDPDAFADGDEVEIRAGTINRLPQGTVAFRRRGNAEVPPGCVRPVPNV